MTDSHAWPAGTFQETSSPEHQLHWIIENCKTVRAANGVSNIVEAIKLASSKHDLLRWTFLKHGYLCTLIRIHPSSLSDSDAMRFNISLSEKTDCMEEVNTELSVYLGMLYLLIEVLKDYDEFAEELSA